MQTKERPIKDCPVCGDRIMRDKPSHILRAKFCSYKCSVISKIGAGNPNYKGVMDKKVICVICGQGFTPNNPYSKRYICSAKCHNKHRSLSNKGKIISNESRAKMSITQKRIQFEKSKTRIKLPPKKYPYKPEKKKECPSCVDDMVGK